MSYSPSPLRSLFPWHFSALGIISPASLSSPSSLSPPQSFIVSSSCSKWNPSRRTMRLRKQRRPWRGWGSSTLPGVSSLLLFPAFQFYKIAHGSHSRKGTEPRFNGRHYFKRELKALRRLALNRGAQRCSRRKLPGWLPGGRHRA